MSSTQERTCRPVHLVGLGLGDLGRVWRSLLSCQAMTKKSQVRGQRTGKKGEGELARDGGTDGLPSPSPSSCPDLCTLAPCPSGLGLSASGPCLPLLICASLWTCPSSCRLLLGSLCPSSSLGRLLLLPWRAPRLAPSPCDPLASSSSPRDLLCRPRPVSRGLVACVVDGPPPRLRCRPSRVGGRIASRRRLVGASATQSGGTQ